MKLTESAAAGPQPGAAEAALRPYARYFAALAHRLGTGEQGIRDLFSGLDARGYGFPGECEAAVLAEMAVIAAGAAS
jgi:hypothetical protein